MVKTGEYRDQDQAPAGDTVSLSECKTATAAAATTAAVLFSVIMTSSE